MNVGSLFSGIGGLDCGLARAGFRHSFFCESDPWRRGVLAERFPGVPCYDDVRLVRAEPLSDVPRMRSDVPDGPVQRVRSVGLDGAADVHQGDQAARSSRGREGRRAVGGKSDHAAADAARAGLRGPGASRVDLLCGGFPCQDLSVAGRRAGLQAGQRSNLFFEFARVADELVQPGGYVLIENVPGLLSSQGGRDFALVLATLAELGFHDLAWRVLDSRYFGVPQRRRRVFVLGRRASGQRCCEVLLEPESGGGDSQAGGEAGQGVAGTLGGGSGSRGWAQDIERMTFVPSGLPMSARVHDADGLAPTLHAGSGPNRGGSEGPMVMANTLKSQNGRGWAMGPEENYTVAYPLARRGRDGESELEMGEEGIYNALRAGDGGSSRLNQVLTGTVRSHPRPGSNTSTEVLDGAAVRRLTPIECERLQGLPDGWTQVPADAPDSRRYAGLGDAVTANVAEWIGRRLLAAETQEQAA